jgi:ectoine hydroxylase-related dioxygenase (phytanoyl-CoA dioxygenase family)
MTDPGFWIQEEVLSAAECDVLGRSLAEQARRSRAGARHLMSHPAVAALAHDDRLLALARRGLGLGAVPFRTTLFEKSGAANWYVVWHQDTALPLESHVDSAEWGPWSMKAGIRYAHAPGWALARILALRVHLDASTYENGPLRVVPGSHRAGLLSDEEVFRVAREQTAVDCLAGRGGVLAMRPLLIHSSPKATSDEPRRVLHIEYAEALELAPGVRLAIA